MGRTVEKARLCHPMRWEGSRREIVCQSRKGMDRVKVIKLDCFYANLGVALMKTGYIRMD